MSDVSESLQIRTDDHGRVIARLRQLGFNGFAFRGAHGWLSIVPYGGPAALLLSSQQLAAVAARLDAPVLHYEVNDFGWSFELALPDGRTTSFTRFLEDPSSWGLRPDQVPHPPPLDESVLAAVVAPDRVRRFLSPVELPGAEAEWRLFAETLGFPEFNELNPTYATDHPDEMLQMGAIEIGHRPQSTKVPGPP